MEESEMDSSCAASLAASVLLTLPLTAAAAGALSGPCPLLVEDKVVQLRGHC